MKPNIVVMSYGELTRLVRKNKKRFLDKVNIRIIDRLIVDAIQIAKKLEEKNEADVFVCSGNFTLSEYLKSPFVQIKATGFDVLFALKKAKAYADQVAVITHENNRIHCLNDISDVLTMSVRHDTYKNPDEVPKILQKLAAEGIRNIIGPGIVVELATRLGMNGTLIYTEDGVVNALENAVNIAISKKKEYEKAERFRVIMDFAHEGVIATDDAGMITVFNPAAEKIIGIKGEQALNRSINVVLPSLKLSEVIETGKPALNQFQSIGDIKIVTNMIPIHVNNMMAGSVATFQEVSKIQEAEEGIRSKIHGKGLVAKFRLDDIIGNSEQILETKRTAMLYAQSDSTLLITGESGTGKELFAQGIHNSSKRAKRPFVAINCQALPDNLLESELFGYEEGAFTGARKGGKQGFFELAHGGTIFLDEIGEIPPRLQSRLLRVLEEREVMRIGSNKIVPVDIRVIAATNISLWDRVNQGKFREDLFYRLNVLELYIPPLRMRKTDIPLLVTKFLTEFRKDLTEKEIQEIANHPAFSAYGWAGNVRELKNIVERLAVLYNKDREITVQLKTVFERHPKTPNTIQDYNEYEEISRVLKEVRGNKTAAAKKLGMSRTTLWRKLKAR